MICETVAAGKREDAKPAPLWWKVSGLGLVSWPGRLGGHVSLWGLEGGGG